MKKLSDACKKDLNFTEENDFLKVIKREGLTSMLASPIVFGEDTIGVIISYTRRSHRFSNGEKKVFKKNKLLNVSKNS